MGNESKRLRIVGESYTSAGDWILATCEIVAFLVLAGAGMGIAIAITSSRSRIVASFILCALLAAFAVAGLVAVERAKRR